MFDPRRLALCAALLMLFCSSGATADESNTEASVSLQPGDGLRIVGADDQYSLQARGYFQLYYDFRATDGEPDHSSMSFRRLRADIRGHAFTEDLTFRLMPEFARQTALADGWVSYRFSDAINLRAGQYNVPFNWERHVSSLNQLYSERSAANNEFQWPGGRDIGVMAHGDLTDWFRYGVGIYSGQGANAARSGSTGHLVTGRAMFTPLGEYPGSEVPIEPTEDVNVSFAVGAFYAHQNSARDWARWHADEPMDANVASSTADAHLQWSVLSVHLSGFHRHVTPGATVADPELPDDAQPAPIGRHEGVGVTGHLGAVVVPERLTLAARYSTARPNLDVDDAARRQALGGVHLFHRGLDSRLQAEAGLDSTHNGDRWVDSLAVNLNYQLIF